VLGDPKDLDLSLSFSRDICGSNIILSQMINNFAGYPQFLWHLELQYRVLKALNEREKELLARTVNPPP